MNKKPLRPLRKKPSAPSSKKSNTRGEIPFEFSDLIGGLRDALAHAKGKLTLKTTRLPKPAPRFTPEEIRALREKLRASQAVFGRLLNVPVVTVAKWEHGERTPSGAALRLLEIAQRSPDVLLAVA